VTTRERAVAALSEQIARTIEWSRCIDALYERGCRVFLELGPGQRPFQDGAQPPRPVEAAVGRRVSQLRRRCAWVLRSCDRSDDCDDSGEL
jgi:[acyl-carrier-protein] S-malonyltransferase